MSVIKGLDVLISVGETVVGGQRNASLEMSAETLDTTTKLSGGWSEKVAGLKSWTSSCDGVYFLNDEGLKAVENAFMSGTPVNLTFKKGSDFGYKGSAIITSLSAEAGQDDVVSYTISFDGSGALQNVKSE